MSTVDTSVNFTRVYKNTTKPCTHEEADTRIMIHVAQCVAQCYRKVTIPMVDTDVVVLAVSDGERKRAGAYGKCSTIDKIPSDSCCSTGQLHVAELQTIQRFAVLLYSRTCGLENVNEARKHMFAQGSISLENIHLTEASLLEHCKRATYQGGHIRVKHSRSTQ